MAMWDWATKNNPQNKAFKEKRPCVITRVWLLVYRDTIKDEGMDKERVEWWREAYEVTSETRSKARGGDRNWAMVKQKGQKQSEHRDWGSLWDRLWAGKDEVKMED